MDLKYYKSALCQPFTTILRNCCCICGSNLLSTDLQVLTERRLSLVDDIIVFKNSPKFYPIVITEVTVAYDFSYFGRKTSEFK